MTTKPRRDRSTVGRFMAGEDPRYLAARRCEGLNDHPIPPLGTDCGRCLAAVYETLRRRLRQARR